ncbi:MAG: dUTP diphosphatase [Candidatus Marinimicrobia bacterium]|nr:dUTP diphosphatase [Candidatus Neomarinimicrobiota bacterium]MBL7047710.1 dUTP diphosphatase [Candidatus Neomarinimicrobiota bacterium]
MKVKIKPFSMNTERYYRDHGHYHSGDAGLDLYIVEKVSIDPGKTVPIHFQIACESEGNKPYFLIPRSCISNTPLRMSNSIGLIDGGYRGELIAYCDNIKDEPYTVEPGERLFQIVSIDGSPMEFEIVNKLSDTDRGSGGFGSTGK